MQSLPTVSAILLTYNSEHFVLEAIRSVIGQEYNEPMEIIISDDASVDDTVRIIEQELACYKGPHQIRFNRRSTNSGSKGAHLNDVFPIASGDILVSFDADDTSDTYRVQKIVERFRSDSNVFAVYSSYVPTDRFGRPFGSGMVPHPPSTRDTCTWFAQVDAYAAGSTLAVRRAVIEQFGPLDPEVHEDIVLPFRASLLGEVSFIAEPLVRFRRHAGSLTADWGRFASIKDYREWFLLGIQQARKNARSRYADLRSAQAIMPDRDHIWKTLQDIVRESLSHAELTGQLLAPTISTRISTLIRLMRLGAYRQDLIQHACLALMPGMYLKYKRHSLGLKRRNVNDDR